jgi:DNA-binding XRE family transcriptional regulator
MVEKPYDHQDYVNVVFQKKPETSPSQKNPNQKNFIDRKPGQNQLSQKLYGDEPPPPKTYTSALRNEMTGIRLQLKLTQKQLAQRIHVPESSIKNLENGSGTYDPQLIQKIRRLLPKGPG